MNERERQFSREIASLQARVDQLTATCASSDRVLNSLARQSEAALSALDTAGAARLGRKIDLMRLRRLAVTKEIGTLEGLIAARRRVGGSSAPSLS